MRILIMDFRTKALESLDKEPNLAKGLDLVKDSSIKETLKEQMPSIESATGTVLDTQQKEKVRQTLDNPIKLEQLQAQDQRTMSLTDKFALAVAAFAPTVLGALFEGTEGAAAAAKGTLGGAQVGLQLAQGLQNISKGEEELAQLKQRPEIQAQAIMAKQQAAEQQASFKEREIRVKEGQLSLNKQKEAVDQRLVAVKDALQKEEGDYNKASALRREVTTDPVTKQSNELVQSYRRLQASASNPSPAGDIALIFSYMKMLDPGSTVREGEFAKAENAGNIPESIYSQYNKMISGEGSLSKKIREDFVNRAGNLISAQKESQKIVDERYSKLASDIGVRPETVINTELFKETAQSQPSDSKRARLEELRKKYGRK